MSEASNEDLERLASRMALLVADDGEADAAGRAVGAMARRLGLSGGHIKTIFMAGAGRLGTLGRQTADQQDRADRAEDLARGLRHSLDQVDYALALAQQERDALRAENARLGDALHRARNARQVQLVLGLLVLLVGAAAVGFVWLGPLASHQQQVAAASGSNGGFVRKTGADLHGEPDPASPVIGRLAPGTRVPIKALVWNNFVQWAELRLGGRTAYCAATDLDLD